jgi:alpha-galactosidase
VAFPPTSGEIKCVTVYVPLHSGANTLTLSSDDTTTSTPAPTPLIAGLRVVSGPVGQALTWPKIAHPVSGPNVTIPPGGKLTLCDCEGGARVYDDKDIGVTFTNIVVQMDGWYAITVAKTSGSGVSVGVNDEPEFPANLTGYNDDNQPVYSDIKVQLKKGANTLTLVGDGVAGISNPTPTTAPPPPPKMTYEGDGSDATIGGGASIADCVACQDGKKVGYIGEGGTLTFNDVSAPADGMYTINIGYLNGDSSARSALITVNGAAPLPVTFPPTGSFDVIGYQPVTVQLKNGANTLEISNPNGWAPDISGLSAPVAAPGAQAVSK